MLVWLLRKRYQQHCTDPASPFWRHQQAQSNGAFRASGGYSANLKFFENHPTCRGTCFFLREAAMGELGDRKDPSGGIMYNQPAT